MTETELQIQIAEWEGFGVINDTRVKKNTISALDLLDMQRAEWEGMGSSFKKEPHKFTLECGKPVYL